MNEAKSAHENLLRMEEKHERESKVDEINHSYDEGQYCGFLGRDAGHFIMQDREYTRIYNPCDAREGCIICKDMYEGVTEDLLSIHKGFGHFLVRCGVYERIYNPCIYKDECDICNQEYDVWYLG